MKIKVGDKVKIKKGVSNDSRSFAGKIVEINKMTYSPSCNMNILYFNNMINGIWENECVSVKENYSEVDFLDAFKENFKDGI